MPRPSLRSPAAAVFAASAFMAVAGNVPLWRELDALGLVQGREGWLLSFALAGMVAFVMAALLSLFAWRTTLKPLIVLLLFATALTSHFMLRYHVVIDDTMLVNALQTDAREAAGLLDWELLPALLLLWIVPAWIVWRWPLQFRGWKSQGLRNIVAAVASLALAVGLVLLAFQPFSSTMRNHRELRYLLNPLNTLYAAGMLAAAPLQRDRLPLQPLGQDAKLATSRTGRPALFVLVLGETGRSGNFGINGYARATTPELKSLAVATFRNAWSCGTSTAASVPCMFSHRGREAFASREHDDENLLDVLQHAGLAVLWIDNQAGCKGVCDRVAHVSTARENDAALCRGGECYDEIMLQGLDARIAQLPPERRARGVVLVMHQMGSHGPQYWKRSPAAFKRFQPECRSANLQDCTRAEVVNAYDNTVAYTDHMLASTIRWLQAQGGYDTALLYVADHGESLGEGNLYLHGLPYGIAPDVQKHVPWVTWLSPGFQSRSGVTMECLRTRSGAAVSHDDLFHSVLGLMQVSTSAYRRSRDAYAGCGAA
jgi:lipid A ethanolaminephosphotransferase